MAMEFYNNTVELQHFFFQSHASLLQRVAIELGHGDRCDELIEKFLGDKCKIKKRKDPDLPKRALSSYMFFAKDFRPKLKKKFPDLKVTEIMKKTGQEWNKLKEKNSSKLDKYVELANKDKERYEEEMELYHQNKE